MAGRAGLRPGDSILEVNGTPFIGISHEEALKVIKNVSTHFLHILSSNRSYLSSFLRLNAAKLSNVRVKKNGSEPFII